MGKTPQARGRLMDVRLLVLSGRNAGQVISLPVECFRIGRAADCHLRPQSPLVGAHHCEILVEPGAVRLQDLGTPTGTLLNGQRVEGSRVLKNGDRLKVGPLEFEVQLSVQLGRRKRPKVQSVGEAAARAAQAAAENQFDPSKWLGEEEEEQQEETAPRAEASVSSASDSQPGTASPLPPGSKKGSAPNTSAQPDQKKFRQIGPAAGKPAQQRSRFQVPPPEDSAAAAADVLRRYMRGKR